jgi:hypothetical protein
MPNELRHREDRSYNGNDIDDKRTEDQAEGAVETSGPSSSAILALAAISAIIAKEGTMPGSLSVRNLDDDLILRLKRRAARHGRSAAEHREIFTFKSL